MNASLRDPLHIYRALLREAGYLFHPTLQAFHAQNVRHSFRRHSDKSRRSGADATTTLDSKFITQQLRRARQYLYTLQRANQGYVGSLENVLKMAFARKGKRRRQLLQDITSLKTPKLDDGPETVCASRVVPFSQEWTPPENFSALLRKQKTIHRFLNRGGTIPSKPTIPEKNKFGKPFPKSRARNMTRAWYARSADLLLPPLSEDEWKEIYRTGTNRGSVSEIVPPKRRVRATVSVFADTRETSSQILAGLDGLAASVQPVVLPKCTYKVRETLGNPHNLTRRFIRRRVLRTVINNTPIVITDPETGKMAPRWDAVGIKHNAPVKATESQVLSMFE